ncbi:DUF3606 domain-containing protein [Polaromonas sp.]|uniref:DUF3606 domain-containing protein n=1 Tax=Polaromonas sp. TaxID=1869339 RepID=UPI003750AF05
MHEQPDHQQPVSDRIQLCSPVEVRRCCADFRCTEHELRAAVYAVGGDPQRVREYLHPTLRQKLTGVWRQLRAAVQPPVTE